MGPWLIDANDIRGADSFDEGLLHRTNAIEKYLARDASDKFLLVATKGYGKTLLLKSKRLGYGRSGMLWIPENDLVDKPIGDPRVFSDDDVRNIIDDGHYWINIWILALSLAVLKRLGEPPTELQSATLKAIIADSKVHHVTDIFAQLLDMPRSEYFQALLDQKAKIIPIFRSCHSQITIFIDNIDEYFNIHLKPGSSSYSSSGALVKDFWYNAQCGLVEAIDQLHGVNQHVKVFCSVRSEAFSKLMSSSPKSMQYRGHALELSYGDEDLLEIFKKNIKHEPHSNLVEPSNPNPFAAFVGSQQCILRHIHTGEEEAVGAYILRHTLRRPRDIAEVGRKISDLLPTERTVENLKVAINEAATEIAKSYLEEAQPHIRPIDYSLLFRLIDSNVLSRRQVEDISRQYDAAMGEEAHVFCTLYKIGLLGYVDRADLSPQRVQRFVAPGVMTFAGDRVLPEANYYLIHSVLDGMIRPWSERYRDGFNKWNIVGQSRQWRRPSDQICLVEGDIQGYSTIMLNSDLSATFPKQYEEIFRELTRGLLYAEPVEGDRFRIGDVNPLRIIDTLRDFLRELRQVYPPVRIRVGGDYGYVEFEDDGKRPRAGQILRVVARLEPIGIPNCLIVTGRFLEKTRETGGIAFVPVERVELKNVPWTDRGFKISKARGGEPQIIEHLWKCKLE